MEQFSYDSEVVKEIQEEIFESQKKIWKEKKRRVKPHFQTTKNIPTLGLNIRCK